MTTDDVLKLVQADIDHATVAMQRSLADGSAWEKPATGDGTWSGSVYASYGRDRVRDGRHLMENDETWVKLRRRDFLMRELNSLPWTREPYLWIERWGEWP